MTILKFLIKHPLIIASFIIILLSGLSYYLYSLNKDKNKEIVTLEDRIAAKDSVIEKLNSSVIEKTEALNKINILYNELDIKYKEQMELFNDRYNEKNNPNYINTINSDFNNVLQNLSRVSGYTRSKDTSK